MKNNKISQVLYDNDFHKKKSLGQNFLYDNNLLDKIVSEAGITCDDTVLEIGAGPGGLTSALAKVAKKVVAVEIDRSLKPVLTENLAEFDNITLLFTDFMKVDIAEFASEHLGESFKVVANLPYYITTPIIMKVLESGLNALTMTIMVQKEVAQRIISKPGKKDYGVLSVMTQVRSEPSILFIVPATAFNPPPKVDSAMLHIDMSAGIKIPLEDIEGYYRIVRAAFSQRRKQLANSLSSGLSINKVLAIEYITSSGLSPSIRAERLSVMDFYNLYKQITSRN